MYAVTCKFGHHQLLSLVKLLVGRNFNLVVPDEFVFDEVPLDVVFEVGEVFVELCLVPILVLFEVEHPTLHELQRNVKRGGLDERVLGVDENLVIALVGVCLFKLPVNLCAEFVLVVNLVFAEELVVHLLVELALDEVGDFVDFESEVGVHCIEVEHIVAEHSLGFGLLEYFFEVKLDFVAHFLAGELCLLVGVFDAAYEHRGLVGKAFVVACAVFLHLVHFAFEQRLLVGSLAGLVLAGCVAVRVHSPVDFVVAGLDDVLSERDAVVEFYIKLGRKGKVKIECEVVVLLEIDHCLLPCGGQGLAEVIDVVVFEVVEESL